MCSATPRTFNRLWKFPKHTYPCSMTIMESVFIIDSNLNHSEKSGRSGKNAFPPHRILLNPVTWPVVGTYGSWGFFVTTINPPGISWQCPFDDRKLLEANWTKSCVLIMKGVAGSLWTAMSHSITVGNKILKCLPRYESKFVRKTDG